MACLLFRNLMNQGKELARIINEEQFQLFFGKVQDLVFLGCPVTGCVLAANPAFREKIGRVEQLPSCLMRPHVSSFACGEETIETEMLGKGNKLLHLCLHLNQVEFNDQPAFLICGQDIGQQKEEENRLHAAEQEKKALLNEVYHRVKNNLNIIVSLLSLQIKRVSEPSVRLLLQESKSRIFTLALLQQKLYTSERISEVKAGEYLAALAKTVISGFRHSGQSIQLITDTEDCWLDVDVLMPLGLITHELVTNAVLHAFPEEGGGEIQIYLGREGSGHYLYKVRDNGVGFPAGRSLKDFSSLGSQLVLALSRQLKTEVKLEENRASGTGFYFVFKEKAS